MSITPQTLKGGLVTLDAQSGQVLRIFPLQYNPDSLSRTLQVKGTGGEGGDRLEALRLKGPPVETIKLEVELDATDPRTEGDATAGQLGLHAQLAVLESLVYPTSAQLQETDSQASSGSLEIAPAQAPLLLFIWSPQRVVPVRLTEFSITEEAFDGNLNPVRAKVSLGMRVLSVDDLGFAHRGGSLFMSYLRNKETLAARSAGGALNQLGITKI